MANVNIKLKTKVIKLTQEEYQELVSLLSPRVNEPYSFTPWHYVIDNDPAPVYTWYEGNACTNASGGIIDG